MQSFNILDLLLVLGAILYIATRLKHGFFAGLRDFVTILAGVALLLFVLAFSPVSRPVQSLIEESQLGSAIVSQVAALEGQVNKAVGPVLDSALSFLSVKPESVENISLPFKPAAVVVDAEAEQEMFELINDERLKARLPPLILDETLTQVARAHSRDMWEKQYFAHDDPEGDTPFVRMEEGGVDFSRAGENLALARAVERAHRGLMASEDHRKNILDPSFGRIGIGVVDGGIYGKMFTQNFTN